ncbi:MAG: bifunctional DNA primase/polymerase, partial [Nitrospira sp.]|nr:bifunctional DNA primase/polymerase [Nitrospira sp.]
MITKSPEILTTMNAVEAYRERGWSILPIRPRDKKPLCSWKEYQTRHPTQEELQFWFHDTENNIGIVAGKISNLTIVDCDSQEAIEFFERKSAACGDSTDTYIVQTPKGRHYYFKFMPGSNNFQAKVEWPGIDLRSEGGYVVAPPSIHPSGKPYTVLHDKPLGIAPAWLFRQAAPIHMNGNGAAPGEDYFAPCEEGGRNMALTRLAGYMLQDMSLTKALQVCRVWNRTNPDPLPDDELTRTVESVAKKEAAKI